MSILQKLHNKWTYGHELEHFVDEGGVAVREVCVVVKVLVLAEGGGALAEQVVAAGVAVLPGDKKGSWFSVQLWM